MSCPIAPITRLNGRVAIVTASTEGIGFAIAQRLAREGAKVVISSRKEANVNRAVCELQNEGLKVTGLVCHVSKAEDRKKLFNEALRLGGLDILVSNAAVNTAICHVLDIEERAWDKIFEVNLKASWLLAKDALPLLRKSSCGRIIFISSTAAFDPPSLVGAYSVSKTALLGLTKAAAKQLAPEKITVNCIAPGAVDTKFSKYMLDTDESRQKIMATIPLNRIGIPHDISGAVAFVASDDANYLTGETIVVSGGLTTRL